MGSIYLISFTNFNNIYIGKTKNILQRFKGHLGSSASQVYQFIKLNKIEKKDINIDIIDTYDIYKELELDSIYRINYYDSSDYNSIILNGKCLNELKSSVIEAYHIWNYLKNNKYIVLNKYKSIMKYNRMIYYYDKYFNPNSKNLKIIC